MASNSQSQTTSGQEVRKYLEGASFPADKKELAEHAKQQQAPSHVVDLLQQLPTSQFGSPNTDKLTEYNSLDELIREMADHVIEIPYTNEVFSPMVSVIPLQLLSYHIAVLRGCSVDQPRNLAKSVTVE